MTEEMLPNGKDGYESVVSVPIAELSTLGAGVASLIPELNTITQTRAIDATGLYRLANAEVGDTLKAAKDGKFWGAMKRADGTSKMAKFQSADSMFETTTTTMINPANMMMAVALYSIEKELGNIAEMEKQIISFLEADKESGIKADVETLMRMVEDYKHSWDNYTIVMSYHNTVENIKGRARQNIDFYRNQISVLLETKRFSPAQRKVNSVLEELEKDFQYYRLSLYSFSLASFLEIMLSGNFNEGHIYGSKDEINEKSLEYMELFEKCSLHLEKMSGSVLTTNMLKAVGTAGKVTGKLLGNIPKKGDAVEDLLQDAASNVEDFAAGIEQKAVREFAMMSNPRTAVFTSKMNDMIRIYNHTSSISFDEKNLYLEMDMVSA